MGSHPVVRRRWAGRRAVVAIGALAVAVPVAAVAVLVGYRWLGADDGPLRTNQQRPAPPLTAPQEPERGGIRLAASGTIVAGPEVEVLISAPTGATEMQVGLDPTFTSTPWRPVAASVRLRIDDVGYQMVFGRFRRSPGSEPTDVSVDGLTVDPTHEAATSSASGRHRASWVRPLSPTAIVVRVEGGRVGRGQQIPYDFDAPPDGDRVSGFIASLLGRKEVERDGRSFGRAVPGTDGLLRVHDELLGQPVDLHGLLTGPWTLTSVDDPAYGQPAEAVEVRHLTRPAGSGLGPDGRFIPLVHDLVVELPAPIRDRRLYVLTPPAELVEPLEFVIDPIETISPAVHVNQNGYRPRDGVKVGYLSGYPGDLGRPGYRAGMRFTLVDATTGEEVHEGSTTARPFGDELGQGDLTGAQVYELDFSAVTAAGRYRVCVEQVGCSVEFEIDDRVWDDLAVSIARSMYHQRSGVALGPPYTAVGRPRPYHPDDGIVVVESGYRLLDGLGTPRDELFAELAVERTERVVPEAWGGHFDAGDWDRRIDHLYYVRTVVELVERHPDRFADLWLGIPESGDEIPDLIDEGLWTLDLYQRLQRPDGSIPGGVEAAEHPQPDMTSWTDTLAVFAYEPDPFSSYLYAGVAAQTAAVLADYAPDRAEAYLASAQAAMAWADTQADEPGDADLLRAHRSVAAVSLFKATGDERWHDLFRETTTLGDGVDSFLSCHEHTRCDAGWIYLSIEPGLTDPGLRTLIETSFVATADEIVAAADETAFGWALENRFVPLVWGLGVGGSPSAVGLLRAYELTGAARYLEAAQRSAAVSLGANPTNTVYVTGVGRNPVRYPLIVDTVNGGLPVWPGTPVYGTHRLSSIADERWVEEFVLGPAGVDPLPSELPYLWQWMDVPDVPMFNEFTVFQSHGAALHAFGLLAAADES